LARCRGYSFIRFLGDFDTAYELSQRVLQFDPKRIRNWHLGDKGTVHQEEIDDVYLPKHSDTYNVSLKKGKCSFSIRNG